MQTFLQVSTIALHALIAWVFVEVFVNNAYRLSRRPYICWHYVSVITAFAVVFFLYFIFFAVYSVFTTTAIAMIFLLLLELVVFRYLYTGKQWFLNYVDWILPMFIAWFTIYFVGVITI